MDSDAIREGMTVYDVEMPEYTVLEVIEKPASEVVASEEVTERGHVVYEEQTVAERHPSYPETDFVVRLQRGADGRELLFPVSRIVSDSDELFDD